MTLMARPIRRVWLPDRISEIVAVSELWLAKPNCAINAPPTNAAHHPRTSPERRPCFQLPASESASELNHSSCMMTYGITKFANGMNHPPMLQPGVYRAPLRPSDSAFFAERH